jgi:hypothetical protein
MEKVFMYTIRVRENVLKLKLYLSFSIIFKIGERYEGKYTEKNQNIHQG